jgi:DNA invertase Pin-like site-specific DNA recombinase
MPDEIAYSYVRFSDPSQAAGDSLRRQTEAAAAWCQRNGVRLDTSLTLHDLGKSAFRGKHHKDDRHALGAFIRLAEAGRVPKDSYLIIERLDRLTREEVEDALELFLRLKKLVRIVQLSPVEVVHSRHSSAMQLMMALVELMRGHDESQAKSERVGAAWAQRRKKARNGAVLTRRLPAWVEERDGRLHLIPSRAEVVRRIFALAGAGFGLYAVVRRLTEEGVPAFGESGRWSVSYLHKILKDRRAVGELQPMRNGRPDGEPIGDYFPRCVGDDAWWRARQGAKERHRRPGRVGAEVNVFMGLLRSARDGAGYVAATEAGHGRPYRVLRSTAPRTASGGSHSFPLPVFEAAVLGQLKELDPREVLKADDGPDEVESLRGEKARVEARIGELEAELLDGDVTLARVVRALEGRQKELAEKLAEAEQSASHPASAAWGEAKSILKALDTAPDPHDMRLRLRSALRRLIDSIYLLVVPRGRDRLLAVQVWFAEGDRHRDYLVLHRPAKANASARQEGMWWVRSLATVAAPADLDLRRREDVEELEAALTAVDLGNGGAAD